MLAIANQRVDASISDTEVPTLLIGTGETFGGDALGGSPPAFHLAPGGHRCRDRFHAWRGETTDRAIQRRAGLI